MVALGFWNWWKMIKMHCWCHCCSVAKEAAEANSFPPGDARTNGSSLLAGSVLSLVERGKRGQRRKAETLQYITADSHSSPGILRDTNTESVSYAPQPFSPNFTAFVLHFPRGNTERARDR